MSILSLNTVNEQSGVLRSFEFDTAPEDMHILYYIARDTLYSDELMALLREYGVNGMDIHVATGQAERPIRVTLPTQLDAFLKIRDFGTGLDEEGIKEYAMFGRSSKRGDPLQTGQLGIGCKCGFTYGDSFLVNSYQRGKVSTWNAYIDPSNRGRVDQMAVVDTVMEPDGIEVIIPIRPNDIDKCHEKAMFLYSFAKVTPQFVNQTEKDVEFFKSLKEAQPLYRGEGWRYTGDGRSYVVMGNVPYPIDVDSFTDIELSQETRNLVSGGLVLECKMNEVDFAASREKLKYSPKTKANLSARLNGVTQALLKQASTSFDGCQKLWDAKLLYKNLFDLNGKLHRLRHLFVRGLKFKGFPINNDDFSCSVPDAFTEADMSAFRYIKPGYGSKNKVQKQVIYSFRAQEGIRVIVNDTGITGGILNRIVPLIEGPLQKGQEPPEVYLLCFRDATVRQAWEKMTGYDGPTESLASLPKEPLNKYYSSASNDTLRNSKHTSREFTYDGDGKSRFGGHSRSEFWEIADVDLKNDEGVYVTLNRFNYELNASDIEMHPASLQRTLEKFTCVGMSVPDVIYGFKPSSADKARNNPKMIPLWQWLKNAATTFLAAQTQLAQNYANRHYVSRDMNTLHPGLLSMMRRIVKWANLPTSHPLRDLAAKVEALCKYDSSRTDRLISLADYVNYKIPQTTPVHDIKADYQALASRYPLLFKVDLAVDDLDLSKIAWNNALEQYVTLIDAVTP